MSKYCTVNINKKVCHLTYIQDHVFKLQHWFELWRIKINENKSTHITFSFRSTDSSSVFLNAKIIPKEDSIKYLGDYLDKRLTWATT